jgi:hypothetical protein
MAARKQCRPALDGWCQYACHYQRASRDQGDSPAGGCPNGRNWT